MATCSTGSMRRSWRCPPLPSAVLVDVDMWEKIVLNLLSNAVKYTLAGAVHLGLRATADGVELTVSDGTATDTDGFTWTVVNSNQAPVFSTDITNQTNTEGDVVSLDADATDPDLDTLTYSATSDFYVPMAAGLAEWLGLPANPASAAAQASESPT